MKQQNNTTLWKLLGHNLAAWGTELVRHRESLIPQSSSHSYCMSRRSCQGHPAGILMFTSGHRGFTVSVELAIHTGLVGEWWNDLDA